MTTYANHKAFIRTEFKVFAETENAIFFEAYGEKIAEIGEATFDCQTLEEFWELVEWFGDETFEV